MTSQNPLFVLNNGVQIPAVGLGVFQSSPEDTGAAVEFAIRQGYRLIDTAAAYFNERQVGEGIRRSGISRDEVFIETKIWISDYGYEATLHACDKSVGKLGVERIDLLLLHQALPSRFDLTLDAYRALEKLLADGKVRAVGVSNFMLQAVTGLAIGVPVALFCVRYVKSQLYEITTVSVPVITIAVAVLMSAAAIAGLIPALRAASIDPARALRAE